MSETDLILFPLTNSFSLAHDGKLQWIIIRHTEKGAARLSFTTTRDGLLECIQRRVGAIPDNVRQRIEAWPARYRDWLMQARHATLIRVA